MGLWAAVSASSPAAVRVSRASPVVREGVVAIAELMQVALSADHRVTDGAQGAQFLNEIRRLLESPAALLVS